MSNAFQFDTKLSINPKYSDNLKKKTIQKSQEFVFLSLRSLSDCLVYGILHCSTRSRHQEENRTKNHRKTELEFGAIRVCEGKPFAPVVDSVYMFLYNGFREKHLIFNIVHISLTYEKNYCK